MHICFLDESGDSSTLDSPADAKQAALIVAGIFVDAKHVPALTADFIALKRLFFPKEFAASKSFDALLREVKGAEDITRVIRKEGLRAPVSKRALLFLDGLLDLCVRHQVKLVGRAWIKEVRRPMNEKSVYSLSAQMIAERFQAFLEMHNSGGMIIADFRDWRRNRYVAHSVFTQMHKKAGSAYPRLQETVTFGISDNHAGLQITDLLTSAALLPIVSRNFLVGRFRNAHTHPVMHVIAQRVERKIRALEFSYRHPEGMCRGLTVSDPIDKRARFFTDRRPHATANQTGFPAAAAAPTAAIALTITEVTVTKAIGGT